MTDFQFSSKRVTLTDDSAEVYEYFYQRGYTDGLPVVAPTEQRVEGFLRAAARDSHDIVSRIPPSYKPATIEKVAIIAVMAGCRPQYMDVLISAIEAVSDPQFQLAGIQVSTSSITPCLIVNGPVRQALEINCASGALGPGWRANATIGRALRLLLVNVGGATPGEVDKASQGFAGKYTLCFGEYEEESPWQPLHVERGFAPQDSAVTAIGVNGSINLMDNSNRWEDVLHSLTVGLLAGTANNYLYPHSQALVVINPLHARMLAQAGFSKERLKEHFFENARIPKAWLSERRKHLRLGEGAEYFEIEGRIPLCWKPENFLLVVAGGLQGGHSCFLPGGMGRSVTKAAHGKTKA